MKTLKFIVLSIFSASVLCACGGGGGGGSGSNPPSDTVYTLPRVFDVIPTTGSTLSFNLSGKDNQGHTISGSLSIKNAGPVTVSGTDYIEFDELLSLTTNLGASITGTTNEYFDPTTKLPVYSYSPTTGLTRTVVKSNPEPATAKINDFGNLDTLSISDGGSETGTWQLKANGSNADLAQSYVTKDSSQTITNTEDDTYTIDLSGNILKLTIHEYEPASNYTLDVSGNRV